MRKGILSDKNNHVFEPSSPLVNEILFGNLSVDPTHEMVLKKRKYGYKSTPRPPAPYLAHHELSQILSPTHGQQHHEAFAAHAKTVHAKQEYNTFRGLVEKFYENNSSFKFKRRTLPETAFLFEKMGLNPDFFNTNFNNPSETKTKKPLHQLYPEILNKIVSTEQIPELERTFDEAMRNLLADEQAQNDKVAVGYNVDFNDRIQPRS